MKNVVSYIRNANGEVAVDDRLNFVIVLVAVAAEVEAQRPVGRHLRRHAAVHEAPVLLDDAQRMAAFSVVVARVEHEIDDAAHRTDCDARRGMYNKFCKNYKITV